MFKKSMAVLAVILALVAGYSIYDYQSSSQELETVADAGDRGKAQATQVAVYVTGAVESPGVVYVDMDGRVAEAVNKCGGLLPTADMAKVNMAETVKDGMQIKVPEKLVTAAGSSANGVAAVNSGSAGVGVAATGSKAGNSSGGDMVNINTASVDELKKLKGVGPAMAQRIIDYREANGAFQSPEDLQKVKGIGKAKFAKMKEQVAV